MLQVHLLTCRAQHDEGEEHEGDAIEKVAHYAVATGVDEQYAYEEGWIDHGGQIYAIAQ